MEENDTLTHIVTLVIFRIGASHASTLFTYTTINFAILNVESVEKKKKRTKIHQTKFLMGEITVENRH